MCWWLSVAVLMSVMWRRSWPPTGNCLSVRWYEATPFTCGSTRSALIGAGIGRLLCACATCTEGAWRVRCSAGPRRGQDAALLTVGHAASRPKCGDGKKIECFIVPQGLMGSRREAFCAG